MVNKNFILSEKGSDRIKRHLLFWACWWLYFGLVHAANPMGKPEISYFRNLPFTISESFLLLIPQTLLAYPLLYFVLPRLILNSEYLKAILWTIFFLFLSVVANTMMILHLNSKILSFILPDSFLANTQRPPALSFSMGIIGSLKGALSGAAIAVGIKLLKLWYLKEKRNVELQKEKTAAQLQLLTAQVHPHFLFNTLNNIYSKAQTESPDSAKMIMELSHILRYILDEGTHELVPLENELQMIKDYIHLEKMRYDQKLDMHVSFPLETQNLYITPLLLLPFVENCFKHGSSKMLNNPWINLKIELQGESLFMKLMNGKKTSSAIHDNRKGTGIENVRRRLDLLYQDKYTLQINEDEEVFIINLSINLVKVNSLTPDFSPANTKKEYA